MINPKNIFHKISYLQYPMMLTAVFYSVKPYFAGFETIWINYNFTLIFAGLGISLSTLQDTRKTQNNFSKRIWENPKKGKTALLIIALTTLLIFLTGMFGVFLSNSKILQELSFGTIVFGLGMMGLLKAAIEMFENHRKDKNIGVGNE